MSMLPGALRAKHAQKRWADDWYVEPPECVHSLFDAVTFDGTIHDPCCGGGTIPTVAQSRGYRTTGSDIRDRGYGGAGVDFFEDHRQRDNIVSNPPYKLGEKFVHHALTVTERKVAIVMRISFLAGQRRLVTLYQAHQPEVVVILSKRPSMPPGGTDIPAKGGTADYCWLVWSRDHSGPTHVVWV